jgi:uncharacterized membrane protein HdeD (DUF308 family)
MLDSLSRRWWAVALRGVAAVLFGAMALVWPGITLFVLVVLFGVYALMDGALTLAAALRDRNAADNGPGGRGWIIARGVFGIAIGVLAVLWPGITAVVLLWSIAAWAVVTGVFEVVVAIRLRREMDREWLLALSGVLAVVFGLTLVVWPAAGALALVTVIGAAALLMGLTLLVFGFRLRHGRADSSPGRHYGRPAAA